MWLRKHLHLLISICVVFTTAFVYGFNPSYTLPLLFDFQVNTTDLKNVFRAIMGLYLGCSLIWFLGIRDAKYWKTATILNLIFMGGLAFGRIISLMIDGVPSMAFAIGTLGELVLAVFAYYQLKKFTSKV